MPNPDASGPTPSTPDPPGHPVFGHPIACAQPECTATVGVVLTMSPAGRSVASIRLGSPKWRSTLTNGDLRFWCADHKSTRYAGAAEAGGF